MSTRREMAAEAVDAFEPGINTYWLFTPFAEEDFGVPKAKGAAGLGGSRRNSGSISAELGGSRWISADLVGSRRISAGLG